MLKIKADRTYKISYSDPEEEVSFSVTFKFKNSEDAFTEEIRSYLRGESTESKGATLGIVLRKSIVGCEDILDSDTGKPIKIINDDGSINEDNQKLVWEVTKNLSTFYVDVLEAFNGITLKNLKAGLMQRSNGDGDQKTASDAS